MPTSHPVRRLRILPLLAAFAYLGMTALFPAFGQPNEPLSVKGSHGIAHMSPDTATVGTKAVKVRLLNDTALPLKFSPPVVVPLEPSTPTFTVHPHVFDATHSPPLLVDDGTVIPIGGYLAMSITTNATKEQTGEASLRVAVTTTPTRLARGHRGRVYSVSLHAGTTSTTTTTDTITPNVTDLTIRRTLTLGLGGKWLFDIEENVDNDELPVTVSGDCKALAKALPPAPMLAPKAADTAQITATCDDKDGKSLKLTASDVHRSGATYDGVLHLTADGKSDVKLTLQQRVGAGFAVMAVIAGIVAGVFLQRRTKVSSTQHRLSVEVGRIRRKWDIQGLDLSLTEEIAERISRLEDGVRGLGVQHLVSLADTDPDVTEMTDEIETLHHLQITWAAFARDALELKKLTLVPPPQFAGYRPDSQPPRGVVTRADRLLEDPITVDTLDARATDVRAQTAALRDWIGTAKTITVLATRFPAPEPLVPPGPAPEAPPAAPAVPPAAPAAQAVAEHDAAQAAVEEEGEPAPKGTLEELEDQYVALWFAEDSNAIGKVKEALPKIARAAELNRPELDEELVAVPLDQWDLMIENAIDVAAAGAGQRGRRRPGPGDILLGHSHGVGYQLDEGPDNLGLIWHGIVSLFFATGRGLRWLIWRPVARFFRFIGHRVAAGWRYLRLRTYTVLGLVAAALALFAVSWTGLQATWMNQTDFGWSGLIPAFLWGIVTASVLDLLVSALDRLRPGSRSFYGIKKPAPPG